MPTNQIFLDRTNKRLLTSTEYPEAVSFESLIHAADGAQIPLQIIGVNQAEDGRYESEPYGDSSLLLTVANPKERPDSGTFVLLHDSNESDELHLEHLNADALERAINALSSVNALGGVQVSPSGKDGYLIQALQDADWSALPLTVARESLAPHGLAVLVAINEGDTDKKATWHLHFAADPYGYIDSWEILTGASVSNTIATSGAGENYQTERLEINGPVKGGLFTLTYNDVQSAPIPWDASAADVEAAANSLSEGLAVSVIKESSRTWLITRGQPGYFVPFGTRNSLVSWQGVRGTLALNTTQLAASMAGKAEIPAQLQILETRSTTNRKPVYIEKISIDADLISGVDLVEIPIPNDYITEAPEDGLQYGRQDGAWTVIDTGIVDVPLDDIPYVRRNQLWEDGRAFFLQDAPADGTLYARKDGVWEAVPADQYIGEAPEDGTTYVRKDATWEQGSAHYPLIEPQDGTLYARRDGSWEAVPADQYIGEAPEDGQPYIRKDAAWEQGGTYFLGDAPADGSLYGRKDNAWEIFSSDQYLTDAPEDGSAYERRNAAWIARTYVAVTEAEFRAQCALNADFTLGASIALTSDLTVPIDANISFAPGVIIDPAGFNLTFHGTLNSKRRVFPRYFTGDIKGAFGGEAIDARWFGVNGRTLDVESVDTGTNEFVLTNHPYETGDRVVMWNSRNNGQNFADLPAPILLWETYIVEKTSADRFRFQGVTLTTPGGYTHRVSRELSTEMQAAIDAYMEVSETGSDLIDVKIPRGSFFFDSPLTVISGSTNNGTRLIGASEAATRIYFLAFNWDAHAAAFLIGTAQGGFDFGSSFRDMYLYVYGAGDKNVDMFFQANSPAEGFQLKKIQGSGWSGKFYHQKTYSFAYNSGTFAGDRIVSANHGLPKGAPLSNSGGGIGINASSYYVADVQHDSYALAPTFADALDPSGARESFDVGDSGTLALLHGVPYQSEISHLHLGSAPSGICGGIHYDSPFTTNINNLTLNASNDPDPVYDIGPICTQAGDVFTRADHGLQDNDKIRIYYSKDRDPLNQAAKDNWNEPTHPIQETYGGPTNASKDYYVINRTDDTFQISEDRNGFAVSLRPPVAGLTTHFVRRRFVNSVFFQQSSLGLVRVDSTNLEDTDKGVECGCALVARNLEAYQSLTCIHLFSEDSSCDAANIKNDGNQTAAPWTIIEEPRPTIVDAYLDIERGIYKKPASYHRGSTTEIGDRIAKPTPLLDSAEPWAALPRAVHRYRVAHAESLRVPLTQGLNVPILYDAAGNEHLQAYGAEPTLTKINIGAGSRQLWALSVSTSGMYEGNCLAEMDGGITLMHVFNRSSSTDSITPVIKVGNATLATTPFLEIRINDTVAQTQAWVDARASDGTTTITAESDPQDILNTPARGANIVFLRMTADGKCTLIFDGARYFLGTLPGPLRETYTPTAWSGTTISITDADTYFTVGDRVQIANDLGSYNLAIGLRRSALWVVSATPTGIEVAAEKGGTPITVSTPSAGNTEVIRLPGLYLGGNKNVNGRQYLWQSAVWNEALSDAHIDYLGTWLATNQYNMDDDGLTGTWIPRGAPSSS